MWSIYFVHAFQFFFRFDSSKAWNDWDEAVEEQRLLEREEAVGRKVDELR